MVVNGLPEVVSNVELWLLYRPTGSLKVISPGTSASLYAADSGICVTPHLLRQRSPVCLGLLSGRNFNLSTFAMPLKE